MGKPLYIDAVRCTCGVKSSFQENFSAQVPAAMSILVQHHLPLLLLAAVLEPILDA